MQTKHSDQAVVRTRPWNKGKLVGPKPPFKLREIWVIRIRLQIAGRIRDLALFNLAIDSKLRGCDLVNLRKGDVAHGSRVIARAAVVQRKTDLPIRFELTEQTRDAVQSWIAAADLLILRLAVRAVLVPEPPLEVAPFVHPDSIRRSSKGGQP